MPMAIKSASVQPTRLGAGSQAAGPPRQNGYRVYTPLPDMYSTQTVAESPQILCTTRDVPATEFLWDRALLQRSFSDRRRQKRSACLGADRQPISPWVPVKRPAIQVSVYDSPKMAPYRVTMLG